MSEPRGRVFDIQRFSIHDGPGIRTTVFLKGCPLHCAWCHNPESQDGEPEISFTPERCIGCGYCFSVCPRSCHVMVGDRREFRREACVRCGLCAERCYAGALERIGREMTVGEVIEEVAKDRPFYDTSGGGMTVSGGEPLAQFAFTSALLVAARAAGLHTCLETAGFAPFERLAELRPNVDLFLYDYKETDPDRHRAHTGVPREGIVENLRRLDALGAAVVLRCPIVPGLNDRPDHFRGIAELANGLAAVREIHLLPYHPLGVSKSRRIGKAAHVHRDTLVDDALVAGWVAEVARLARLPVRRS